MSTTPPREESEMTTQNRSRAMSDLVELIDSDGHTIGWCRSVSPEYDQGGHTVVQLDEYTPKCATLEGE